MNARNTTNARNMTNVTAETSSPRGSVLVAPAEGERCPLPPVSTVTVKLAGARTAGSCAVLEAVAAPGTGPDTHVHSREAEAFYVLEGAVTFVTVYGAVEAGPGTFVHSPRGALHAWRNDSSGPVRFLAFVFPAGFEGYFADLSAHIRRRGKDGEIALTPAEIGEQARAIAARYGVTPRPLSGTPPCEDPVRMVTPGSGERFGVMADRVTLLATGAETDGAYTLFEESVPPMGGVPFLHTHAHEDETFYVLEGEITFSGADGAPVAAPAGTLLHSPKGTPHAFLNRTDRPARLLCLATPGVNMEAFFRTICGPAPSDADLGRPAAPPAPEQVAAVLEAAARHGILPAG